MNKRTIVSTLLVALLFFIALTTVSATTDSVKSHLDDIIKKATVTFDSHPLHNDLEKCDADTLIFRQRLTVKQQECGDLAKKLADAEALLQTLKDQLAQLQAQLTAALAAQAQDREDQLREIERQLVVIANLIADAQHMLENNPEREAEARNMLAILGALKTNLENQKAALFATESDAVKALRDLIALKEKQIIDQEKVVAQLKAQLAQCQTGIPVIEKDITENEGKCTTIRQTIEELRKKVTTQKELVEKIRVLVAKVKTTHGGGENADEDTWPQVKKEVEHILAGVLKEKTDSDAAHATKRAEIEAKCKADENALRAKIEAAEKELKTLQDRLNALDLMIPKLEAAITALKALIARLEGEIKVIGERCTALEGTTKVDPADEKELNAIKEVIDFTEHLFTQKRITQTSRNDLVTKFTALKVALEKLISDKQAAATAAYKKCLKEKSDKEAELLQAKKDLLGKEAELKAIRDQIEHLKKLIAEKEGLLKQLRDSLRHLLDQCLNLLRAHDAEKKSFEALIADIQAIIAAVTKIIADEAAAKKA